MSGIANFGSLLPNPGDSSQKNIGDLSQEIDTGWHCFGITQIPAARSR